MVDSELSVGKYDCTVFLGCDDAFFGIVDGMGKRIDIVAATLYVGHVLYIAFDGKTSVGQHFMYISLQADIVYLSVVFDTVVKAVLFVIAVFLRAKLFNERGEIFG